MNPATLNRAKAPSADVFRSAEGWPDAHSTQARTQHVEPAL
jgi:hypothetical protein